MTFTNKGRRGGACGFGGRGLGVGMGCSGRGVEGLRLERGLGDGWVRGAEEGDGWCTKKYPDWSPIFFSLLVIYCRQTVCHYHCFSVLLPNWRCDRRRGVRKLRVIVCASS